MAFPILQIQSVAVGKCMAAAVVSAAICYFSSKPVFAQNAPSAAVSSLPLTVQGVQTVTLSDVSETKKTPAFSKEGVGGAYVTADEYKNTASDEYSPPKWVGAATGVCSIKNPMTGECTCPAGFVAISSDRNSVPSIQLGSQLGQVNYLYICMPKTH